ncbi:hypothetical protein [Streptomyces sp. NPDC057877]|uniref:hypothetical protein n=1 Tax=Streptomyces sp. NPDC057877 TaxID=3346269 RepID=UPI003689204D
MQIRGSALRLTAVSALVVLTLTGFSTGRSSGGSGGGDGGGGCSSSGQDHDSSSSGGKHDDDDDDFDVSGADAGSGGDTATLKAATVELVTCATPEQPYATVEVTNPNATDGVFTVSVTFEDAANSGIISQHQAIDVPALDTVTVRVDLGSAEAEAADVDHCEADQLAPAVA